MLDFISGVTSTITALFVFIASSAVFRSLAFLFLFGFIFMFLLGGVKFDNSRKRV